MTLLQRFIVVLGTVLGLVLPASAGSKAHRRQLIPLNAERLEKVVKELSSVRLLEVALSFRMTTTKLKERDQIEGKLFAKTIAGHLAVRVELGSNVFLKTPLGGMAASAPTSSSEIAPLRPGHLLSFNDILLPFLLWPCYTYEGTRKVLGRNTHIIRFNRRPSRSALAEILIQPWDFRQMLGRVFPKKDAHIAVSENSTETRFDAVDVAYDPALKAIIQVEYLRKEPKDRNVTKVLNSNNIQLTTDWEVVRRFQLKNFKKVDGTWLMKSVEIVDLLQNWVTKIDFIGSAVRQNFPLLWFEPGNLDSVDDSELPYVAM
ncbi:MAG: hypothetical protein LW808_000320 [Verrucomicrobiota bacterium]|nr:MAG: hypothetical protein LW808_000320 [Verrucomicrobiota bacterium]